MILSIVNVIIAIITLGISGYNLKFIKEEHKEKRKCKIYISSGNSDFFKDLENQKLDLIFENVGDNDLIDMGVELYYPNTVNKTISIGTLRSDEKVEIFYELDECIARHIELDNHKSEFKIFVYVGYFNKYFNSHIIEKATLDLLISNNSIYNDFLYIRTNHFYLESRKYKEYRQ